MDSISNILLQIQGDASDGETTLEQFRASLKAFGAQEETAEANVKATGEDELAALNAALTAFARRDATATARIVSDTSGITEAAASLAAFSAIDTEAEVHVEVPPTSYAKLTTLSAQLNALNERDVRLDVDLEGAAVAYGELQRIGTALNLLDDESIQIELDATGALIGLAQVDAAADRLDGRTVRVDVDSDSASRTSGVMAGLGSLFGEAAQGATKLAGSMGGVTVNFGMFGLKLGPVVGLILAAAVAIGVSMVGALSLLVVAIAGAVLALGTLATAFAAALGPAVALAIGVIAKFVSMFKVVKGLEDAKAAATRKSADGSKAAADAEETRRQRLLAVKAALQAVTQSERGVTEARAAATEAIREAQKTEADAATDLSRTNEELKRSTVDAYRAIADAAEDATDALRGVESARLGIESAALATEQAELNLKQFREEAGLAGKAFNDLFKKATDIHSNVDVSSLSGKFTQGGASDEDALKGEQLVLAVKKAKFGEKEATDSLSDAQRKLTDARKVEAEFARDGIKAYEPYRAAVLAQRDAMVKLKEASLEANKLERAGVEGAPGVISAREALAAAEERLTEARRQQARVIAAPLLADDATAKAEQDLNKLSATQQAFVATIMRVKDELAGFFGPAIDAVLIGLTQVANTLPALLNPLRPAFTELGGIVGGVFSGWAKGLKDPAITSALIGIIRASGQLAGIFGNKIFPALGRIFLNIATAAMPMLVSGMEQLGKWLTGVAGQSGNIEALRETFAGWYAQLESVWNLVKGIGAIFAAFFGATQGQSTTFVQTLADMANKIAAFITSARGSSEIKTILADIIPLAISFGKFLFTAFMIVVKGAQIVAPALGGILDALTFFGNIIVFILKILRPFLQVALQIALLFVGGLSVGVIKVLSLFGKLARFAKFLGGAVGNVVTKMIARFAAFASFFPGVFEKLKSIVGTVLGFVSAAFSKVGGALKAPFVAFFDFIKGLGAKFMGVGESIIKAIVKGIKKAPKALYNALKGGLGPLGRLLPGSEPKDKTSPLAGLKKKGRAIVSNLTPGIPLGAKDLSRQLHRSLEPVVANIAPSIPVAAAAGGGGGPQYNGPYIASQNVNLPAAPGHDQLGDPRHQAAQFARELSRRGRGRGI